MSRFYHPQAGRGAGSRPASLRESAPAPQSFPREAPAAPEDETLAIAFDHPSENLIDRMAEGLAARTLLEMRGTPPSDRARPYLSTSAVMLAHACLVRAGRDRGLSPKTTPGRCVELALTTSDFPNALGNVIAKVLEPAYQNARPSYRRIAAERTFTSFRPHDMVRIGDFPVPLQVGETGEVKTGFLTDAKQSVTVAMYSRIVPLSLRVVANDDLGGLLDLATAAGLRAMDALNALFFATCLTPASGLGPNLADGLPVYDASRGNVASAGALSTTTLGDARAKLRNATTADGVSLNTPAAILLVSPAYETAAEELLTKLSRGQEEQNRLTVVSDANLTGARFYVLGAPGTLASYVFGTVTGAGLSVVAKPVFETAGVSVRLSVSFGCGVVDWRGATTGAGA